MIQQRGRALCGLLALVLALALLPAPARADGTADARQRILDCYAQDAESVDLSDCGLNADALNELFYGLLYGNELPWYADGYSYRYYENSGLITEFIPRNLDETEYDRSLYEQKTAEILQETVFPGMDSWQILLSLHDYLAANCAYDESGTCRKGYDLLVGGTAVCSGYARAYMDLAKRAGVECVYVKSDGMDHAWNLARVNGNWYHVDVTWDDPVPNRQGRVLHKYFLLSDGAVSDPEHRHSGWDTDIVCSDTSFDTDCFWEGLTSRICYQDASTSYLRRLRDENQTLICRREEQTGRESVLYTMDEGYVDIGAGRYFYEDCGLTLWNGRLYFSDMERVYSMNTDGSGLKTELTGADGGKCIGGSFVRDGRVVLTLHDHDGNRWERQVTLSGATWHTHSYTAQVTLPTCQAGGYTDYFCECGARYRCEETKPTEHSYDAGQVTRQPTAGESGTRTFTCRICGLQYTEEIPPTGGEGASAAVPGENPRSGARNYWILAAVVVGAVALLPGRGKKQKTGK